MNSPQIEAWAPTPGSATNGSFNFGCRPQVDYSGCPGADKEIISWFYWSMFMLRALVVVVLIIYTIWLFPVGILRCLCPKRSMKPKQGGKAQRYYCMFGLIGNLGGLIFCLIMSQPTRFNVNPMISILFYIVSTNFAVIGGYLTLLTWAEAVFNDSLQVKTTILDRYRKYWYAYLTYRFVVETPLCILSASNVSNSYLIVHRVWLFDWTSLLIFIVTTNVLISSKLLKMLREKEFGRLPISKVTRFRTLFLIASVIATIGTILHSVFLETIDNTAWLAVIAIGSYHIPGVAGSIWFLTAQPVKFEVVISSQSDKLSRDAKGSSSES